MSVKYRRLLNRTHHKHEPQNSLACALRCSSKLQKIQSLENFVSMAIQDTQTPIYTNTHCFCIFLFFFFFFLVEKQNKPKLKRKQTKTN